MAANILDTKLSYIESKTKAKYFAYPKSMVEGSPAAPVERPIGPSVKVISPVKLDYPFLTKICFVSFYNYHARAHESRRHQLLSNRERRGLGPIQGWNNKELYSYLRTASLNKTMFLRMKKFLIINIHLSPAELQERLVEEVMPAAWGRSGYKLSHQHDAVYRKLTFPAQREPNLRTYAPVTSCQCSTLRKIYVCLDLLGIFGMHWMKRRCKGSSKHLRM
jgi:hypothetical protein